MSEHDTFFSITKNFVPNQSWLFSATNYFAWLIFIIIVVGILSFLLFLYFLNRKYNKKIVIWEEVGTNNWIPTRYDRGCEILYSTAGDTITYLRKHKKYMPNLIYQTGDRTYYVGIRSDDEWINFKLADLNSEAKRMGARFLHKEMRYSRTAIQKGLKDRYDDQTFLTKYLPYIITFGYLIIIGVMMYMLFDKFVDIAGTINAGISTTNEVLSKANDILVSLENICTSGGSGIRK